MNKIYYEFIYDGGIYEIDINKNELEKSIQLALDKTKNIYSITKSEMLLKRALKFDSDIRMGYEIFDNIHIRELNDDLIQYKNIKIIYDINRRNKIIKVDSVNFYHFDENKNVSTESSFREDLNIKFYFDYDYEIEKIIRNKFYKIVYHFIHVKELQLYKYLNGLGYIRLEKFINLFKEVDDKKKIKNYLIKKKFK